MCIIEIRYIESTDNRIAISEIYEESWKYAYNGINVNLVRNIETYIKSNVIAEALILK